MQSLSGEPLKKWYQVLHSDPELREKVEALYQRDADMVRGLLARSMTKVKILGMLKEALPDWKEVEKLDSMTMKEAESLFDLFGEVK